MGGAARLLRHVPLLFFGSGIGAGVSDRPVRTVDIAPTLAALAGVRVPGDLDGTSLLRSLAPNGR